MTRAMTPADERRSDGVSSPAESALRPAPPNRPAAQIDVRYHAFAEPPPDALSQRRQFLRSQGPTLMRCALGLCILLVLSSLISAGLLALVLLPAMAVVVAVTAARRWSAAGRARTSVADRLAWYDASGGAWMSKRGIFLGPFDERAGFTGSSEFGPPVSRKRGWVDGYLVLTSASAGILTPDGHRPILICPLEDLRCVELFAGTGRRTLVWPFWAAWKAGRVVLTSTDGHTATITGLPTKAIADLLVTLGAKVRQS